MTFLVLIFIVGFSGIVTETLLFRELLIISQSSELVVAVIIATWLLAESLGAIITEKILTNKNYNKLLKIYSVSFTVFLFLSIFCVRYSRDFIGLMVGQYLDFINITLISFLILLPLGFFHIGLFIVLSKIKSEEKKSTAISSVYFYELLGSIVGGILLSFFLLRNFNVFFIILTTNILFIFILLLYYRRHELFFIFVLTLFLVLNIFSSRIDLYLLKNFYKQDIIISKNSVYNNIVITQKDKQKTFFLNGFPAIISPIENDIFIEELKFYILNLFKKNDLKLAIIESGLGENGFLENLSSEKIAEIDFIEKDREILILYEKLISEIKNKKVNIIFEDAVRWLKKKNSYYDIVFVDKNFPMNLYSNRYFTIDFFNNVKTSMKSDGVFIIIVPGNITYMGDELNKMNKILYDTLNAVWRKIFVIPSEEKNIFFATDEDINFYERFINANPNGLITKKYLEYKLDNRKVEWFYNQISLVKGKVNTDYNLILMYYGLRYWNLLNSPMMLKIYDFTQKISFNKIYLWIFIMILVGYIFIKDRERLVYNYTIFSTGVLGTVVLSLVIFFVQIVFGNVYNYISLLFTTFFSGSLVGSFVAKKIFNKKFIFISEIIIIILLIFLMLINIESSSLIFLYSIGFIFGFLCGFEFNIISVLLSNKEDMEIKTIASRLNFYDLIGGVIGGILIIGILLPTKGILNIINVLLMLKTISAMLIFLLR